MTDQLEEDGCMCQYNDCPIHGRIEPLDHYEAMEELFIEEWRRGVYLGEETS